MDLTLTSDELHFRDTLRAWLKANMPSPWKRGHASARDKTAYLEYLRSFQHKLFEGGWAGISWPVQFSGRGASPIEQAIFQEELALANAPERLGVIGEGLVGPTIIAVGTESQKERYLKPMLTGQEIWCQGFSEPNAGSDLAAANTKAVLTGNDYLINGQKIWTSYAHVADQCLLVVRTDSNIPKHKGLTCLLVDMKTPGIEVRPLRMMSGDASFNEMFFTDVRVPAENILGKVNDGWNVALTALGNERVSISTGRYMVLKREFEQLLSRAREVKREGESITRDPLVRQKLAQAYVELEVFRLNTLRAVTAPSKGGAPGPEGSLLKICWSETNQRMVQYALEVLGLQAQRWDWDEGRWAFNYLRARGNTIEGGTSEIQRNIVAQRVLGLPRSY
jgi:alkylation response protein AidB-like acyl-CoA dehydrogenase